MAKKKSKRKQSKRSNSKQKKLVASSIVILAILLIFIALSLLSQFSIISPPSAWFASQEVTFEIKDECSVIVGNLIHTVANEDICEVRCKSSCELKELNFLKSEFIESVGDCHTCNCSCN